MRTISGQIFSPLQRFLERKVAINRALASLLILLVPVMVTALACAGTPSAPPDEVLSSQKLAENFHEHQQEFEKLLGLFLEDDALTLVSLYHTLPENLELLGISDQRIEDYHVLFRTIGVSRISSFDRRDTIQFTVAERSWVNGYLYTDQCPGAEVGNIDTAWDEYSTSSNGHFYFCQPMEENWYLFLYSGN